MTKLFWEKLYYTLSLSKAYSPRKHNFFTHARFAAFKEKMNELVQTQANNHLGW